MKKDMNNAQLIAGSIIVAAVIIGFSIIIDTAEQPVETQKEEKSILSITEPVNNDAVRLPDESDHIRGSLDAPVTIIEYSDLECPFCKRFHPTMLKIRDEYDGEVTWVYRHFPLTGLHAKARTEAIAAECAASLGGEEAFWTFVDRFFMLSPSNDRTDLDSVFPQIVDELDISQKEFNTCLQEERFADAVDADLVEAGASGGRGTPWSIVIGPDGKMYGIGGARPYAEVSALIDYLLE